MGTSNIKGLARFFLVSSASLITIQSYGLPQQGLQFHQDYRTSYKYDNVAQLAQSKGLPPSKHAQQFLSRYAERYQIPSDLHNLRLKTIRESLTAQHVIFEQHIYDIPVHNAELIVSIDKKSGRVSRVFNQSHPNTPSSAIDKRALQLLSHGDAKSKAWSHLSHASRLTFPSQAELIYFNIGKRFELAYRVDSLVGPPLEHWQHIIDASSGKVLNHKKLSIASKMHSHASGANSKTHAPLANKPSYEDAISALEKRRSSKNFEIQKAKILATGSALVFDPDPRTTLQDASLVDEGDASEFNDAYLSRTLLDITLDAGTYRLQGPWVSIEDWDSPSTPVSTTTDGNWTAQRGDNAFNEANIYFHIDQNQRYVQSLGFSGATGIQEAAITADSDGNLGGDQSIYAPAPFGNRLSFGRGGVDDAEDADVILHEYGHALHYDIVENWGGGDSGAIGEGFGDYWAGSYSLSTPNGEDFNPSWVFTWDGHNEFWPGRRMDLQSATYDSEIDYQAHALVDNINADEMWSTPLFQALQELIALGETRESVDRIVLESFFGLGSGLKMHELAASTLAAAAALEPDGPHAEIFENQFARFNLLPQEIGIAEDDIVIENGPITAGQTISLSIPIENLANGPLSNISASLSTNTNGLTINSGTSSYDDVITGASGINQTPFSITAPTDLACAQELEFTLLVNYTSSGDEESIELNFTLNSIEFDSADASSAIAIPDDDNTGISSSVAMSSSVNYIASLNVDVNISHTYRGDLALYLNSPSGTEIQLKASSNDSTENLIGNYPLDFTSLDELSGFNGENPNGTWTLNVRDIVGDDVGTLNSWRLNIAQCNGPAPSPTPTQPPSPTPSPSSSGGGGSHGTTLLLGLLALIGIRRSIRRKAQ